MCEYFLMPEEITCGNKTPDEVVRSATPRCSMLGCKPSTWYCKPSAFGISNVTSFREVVDVRRPNYCNDTCSLLKSNLPVDKGHYFPIRFTPKFEKLFRRCYAYLLAKAIGVRGQGGNYSEIIAVHWRRGDQILSRCRSHVDLSVNCGSPEVFINKVINHTKTRMTTNSLVYVSTNENQPEVLDKLATAGMLTWRDFGIIDYDDRSSSNSSTNKNNHIKLKSIDIFVVELMLMIHATKFLYWGSSTIPALVNVARSQITKKSVLK